MTPERAIAMLDAQIAKHGETITIKRGGDSLTLRAFVRSLKINELVGGVKQGDLMVVISPTEIVAAGWPAVGDPSEKPHPRMPRENDTVTAQERDRNVEFPQPVFLNGTWVRSNLIVRG